MRPGRFSPLGPADAGYLVGDVARYEPDWLLILPYVPSPVRGAWLAVLGYGAEVLTIPDRVSNPLLGEIRVTWWREALAEAFEGEPRRHPVVWALAATLRERPVLRLRLEAMLEGIAPFLEHGDDRDLSAAIAARRPVFEALTSVLGELAGTPSGGDGLILHALSRSAADPGLRPSAEGPEAMRNRFSRGLAANPGMGEDLAAEILRYRGNAGEFSLPAMPLRLVRARGDRIWRVTSPLGQRLALFTGIISGRV